VCEIAKLREKMMFTLKSVLCGETTFKTVDVGSGPVVLLVHGFPLDHSMWTAQIEHLQENYRVIAPDLRGFGESNGAQPITKMKQFATDLDALLTELSIGEPVVFCGLSMGGYIAFEFAHHFPDRLRGLILCDTKATADSTEAQLNRKAVAEKVLRSGTSLLSAVMPEKLFARETMSRAERCVQDTVKVISSTTPQAVAAASLGMAKRRDVTAELSKIAVPTLVIVGEEDGITTPKEMQSVADAIPGATIQVIANAGHMSPLEQPSLVNEHLSKFLEAIQ